MDSIRVTYGLNKIFEDQKLSVDQNLLQEEVEKAKKDAPEMAGQSDFDVEKLVEQVEEEIKVGRHSMRPAAGLEHHCLNGGATDCKELMSFRYDLRSGLHERPELWG